MWWETARPLRHRKLWAGKCWISNIHSGVVFFQHLQKNLLLIKNNFHLQKTAAPSLSLFIYCVLYLIYSRFIFLHSTTGLFNTCKLSRLWPATFDEMCFESFFFFFFSICSTFGVLRHIYNPVLLYQFPFGTGFSFSVSFFFFCTQ